MQEIEMMSQFDTLSFQSNRLQCNKSLVKQAGFHFCLGVKKNVDSIYACGK
jgi:hypothetical protein